MKYLTVLFSLSCFTLSLAAQAGNGLAAIFREDSLYIASLRDKHEKYLPQDLQKETAILDSIVNEMCEDGFADEDYCNNIRKQFTQVEEGMQQIAGTISRAGEVLSGMERYMNDTLRNMLLADEINTNDAYEAFYRQRIRPGQKEYGRYLEKIKRGEIYIATHIFRYIKKHVWGEDPLITTMVNLYLRHNREEKLEPIREEIQKEKDRLIRHRDSLNLVMQRLLQDTTNLGLEKSRLNREKGTLERQRDSISTIKRDLEAKIGEADDSLKRLKLNSRLLEDSISAKNHEIEEFEGKLASLSSEIQINDEELTGLKAEKFNLTQANDSLNSKNEDLTEENEDLTEENEKFISKITRRDLGLYALTLLVFVLASFILHKYRKKRYQNIAKRNLSAVNEELTKVNDELTAANAQLAISNDKLVALLRELHHRTKNNLQQVNGLLMLHERELLDWEAKNALQDARSHILALGAIHQQLYRNGGKDKEFGKVNIAVYVRDLVEHIIQSSSFVRERASIQFNLQELYLESDEAVDLGLIINELVHNCIKHAFQKVDKPMLKIDLRLLEDVLHLEVCDNGPGLPEGFKLEAQPSFGLRLVSKMVEHRDGKMWYENGAGASFIIRVPAHISSPKNEQN